MSNRIKKIIVNSLTISRILGAFAVPFIFAKIDTTFLIILLAVLFITDFLDGLLARHWHMSTVGGSLLDPLGDKVLAISCIFSLINIHIDYVILLLLEVCISILNIYRTLHGETVKSTMKGKIKTWFLSLSIVVGAIQLFNPNLINDIIGLFGVETTVFTVKENVVFIFLILTGIFEIFAFLSYLSETIKKREIYKKKIEFKTIKEIFYRLFDEKRYKEDVNKPLLDIIRKEA